MWGSRWVVRWIWHNQFHLILQVSNDYQYITRKRHISTIKTCRYIIRWEHQPHPNPSHLSTLSSNVIVSSNYTATAVFVTTVERIRLPFSISLCKWFSFYYLSFKSLKGHVEANRRKQSSKINALIVFALCYPVSYISECVVVIISVIITQSYYNKFQFQNGFF